MEKAALNAGGALLTVAASRHGNLTNPN